MSDSTQIVKKFYDSFQQSDFKSMQDCYHPEIEFSDEVFPLLKGKQAKAMWHMLLAGGKDAGLEITYGNVKVTADHTECDWEARYKFSLTGRNVYNKIHATLWLKDDRIIKHVDRFDFYRWARMAFGLKGLLLGWAPFFRKKVQQNVSQRLQKFIHSHPEY